MVDQLKRDMVLLYLYMDSDPRVLSGVAFLHLITVRDGNQPQILTTSISLLTALVIFRCRYFKEQATSSYCWARERQYHHQRLYPGMM